ncbi:hypothetical protein P170DRAFT_434065 [Aspergillus steynii IBT 23096]|uniref:Uncharacterized protein n=1 Tax=Aspergillus steynii IBT 23096 TaxID=1392250 RepID=A0A2I2GHB1_9EURO|nr:uncharacterized protein P170DRAFT_434065 [Aspergillus steynii IBT 23096]PLB52273.1 hypothetical protein P170DRAFT_434065 [Aspergillus steynii IBT 23096]
MEHSTLKEIEIPSGDKKLIEVDMRSSRNWKRNASMNAINNIANPKAGTEPL